MLIHALILAGILGGCMVFLDRCSKAEDKSEDANDILPEIMEEDIEKELDSQHDSGEPIVRYAEVTCTCGEGIDDILYLSSGNEAVTMVQLPELTEKDIEMTNEGKFRYCSYFGTVCPGAVIEDNEWKMCDSVNGHGTNGHVLNLQESFMMCMEGFGIIYLLSSGQTFGSMEEIRLEHLKEIFMSWWDGEFIFKETIEPIVKILDEKNMIDEYKSYIISDEQFLKMGFDKSQAEVFMIIDMNRVLNKYDITTTERLRHFYAQCYAESGGCLGLTVEGNLKDSTLDVTTLPYYPYYGAGHIQLTHEYGYQAFAIYVALNKYPELKDSVQYLSPANHNGESIQQQYDKLKEEARNAEIDISEITRIVEPPVEAAHYVAENYAWETAGYFWEIGGANDIVDSLPAGDENGVDEITKVVNQGTTTYPERRDAYKNNVMGVIQ